MNSDGQQRLESELADLSRTTHLDIWTCQQLGGTEYVEGLIACPDF